jgi:hypothetical protein
MVQSKIVRAKLSNGGYIFIPQIKQDNKWVTIIHHELEGGKSTFITKEQAQVAINKYLKAQENGTNGIQSKRKRINK